MQRPERTPLTECPSPDSAAETYRRNRIAHWDSVARLDEWRRKSGGYYHQRLIDVYRQLVTRGLRVLEIGCGEGDLLAALAPSHGVGVDFSGEMLRRARARHPDLVFVEQDAQELDMAGPFDVVILSDLANDLWDVQKVLERVRRVSLPSTRVVLNVYSRVWQPVLSIARRIGLARPVLRQNWLTVEDLENLLRISGFEAIRKSQEVLLPMKLPFLSRLANQVLVKLWPVRHLALTNVVIARPWPHSERLGPPTVSVIVPARNEAGNIPAILARIPDMGTGTEIVFVEGHSTDQTYETIQRALEENPGRPWRLFRQTGKGKGDAVRLGFAQARGDVLMILDADLTVPPEERAGRVRERRSARLSHGGQGHAATQLPGQQVLQRRLLLAPRPEHQGHALRDEGALEARLRAHRGGTKPLRGLRSVRGLRPHLRRGQAEPEAHRSPRAVPGAHVRGDEHPALPPRAAPAADGRLRGGAHQVRLTASTRGRGRRQIVIGAIRAAIVTHHT
jgi:SAM-dependent methyltransferase